MEVPSITCTRTHIPEIPCECGLNASAAFSTGTTGNKLTARDRNIVARARKLAATVTTDGLRELAGAAPDSDGDIVRSEALGTAQYLLDELADLAERLDGSNDA